MIKNKIILEVKVVERNYQLEVFPDSPLGEIHDALCMMKAFILTKMQEADKKPPSETAEEYPGDVQE